MIRLYFGLNAALYFIVAAACMLNPVRLQRAVGYFTVDNTGSSEFLAIYAGLEAGLALFFVLAMLKPALERGAIWFALCLYGGLVAFRLPSLFMYHPVRTVTLVLAAGEFLLFLGALVLVRQRPLTDSAESTEAEA